MNFKVARQEETHGARTACYWARVNKVPTSSRAGQECAAGHEYCQTRGASAATGREVEMQGLKPWPQGGGHERCRA